MAGGRQAFDFGNAPANTASYNAVGAYNDGVGVPAGRAMANGDTRILVTGFVFYLGGNGRTSTCSLYVGGATINGLTVPSAGGGQAVGGTANHALIGGGSVRVGYSSDGFTYFGWNTVSGRTMQELDGNTRGNAQLAGYYDWAQAPNSPGIPTVSGGGVAGTATLSWSASTDNGGAPITGYVIEASATSNFASHTSTNVGNVLSATITGLTPGQLYYFRVTAINEVTATAATGGPYSGTASAVVGSAPGAPTALGATAGPGLAALAWTAPTTIGGSAILDYQIDYSLANTFTSPTRVVSNGTSPAKTILPLVPGTTYYFRVAARNGIGTSAWSSTASIAIPARTALDLIEGASVSVAGAQLSLRSTAANPSVVKLIYSGITEGVTTHDVATLPTGTGAAQFAIDGQPQNLALAADAAGNVYVIGRQGSNPSGVLVAAYMRTGTTNVWTAGGMLAQALATTGDVLNQFAATYVAGVAPSPVPILFVLARRAGLVGPGNLSWASVNLANVAASTGDLFVGYGSDPAWLPVPPSSAAANSGALDVSTLAAASQRLAILANGPAVIDISATGLPTAVSKAADGTAFTAAKARVVGINTATYAVIAPDGSNNLSARFYGTNGSLLGSALIGAANTQGAAFGTQWDAYYNKATGQLAIYYVADDSALKVELATVSPVTFVASAGVAVSTTFGAASSTNPRLRIPRGSGIDERRILIEGANVLTGVNSTSSYSDTTGNLVPNAPALSPRGNFDAAAAASFGWAFSDPNSSDTQTAYQFIIETAAGAAVYDSGKVTSTAPTKSLAAATLTNGTAYRWKVRTYDVLNAVGAYSTYGTFTPSSLGTLTVTTPPADGTVYDVNALTVVWSYSQVNGFTQAQRRVRVTRTDTSVLVLDTTMQASTALSLNISGLLSDVPYRIDLDIINTNGSTISTSRTFVSSFASPMPPAVTLSVGVNYIEIDVDNPAPSGSRPEVVTNAIQRRLAGSTDTFVTIGLTGHDGSYQDREVASGVAYEYQAVGSDS